jgi:PAS domain S-box-containing protein
MEEMETAKEELQSVNEELATVNTELESKIDELTQSNNDLDNLLSNVKVGIIFLDRNLHIQRFTPSATELVNLIPSDVGRPFQHVVTNIMNDNLLDRVRVVLDTLEYQEDEIQTKGGKWYWMGIGPYRVRDQAVEGVVITFTEITDQKRAQEDLAVFADRMAGRAGSERVYQYLSSLLSALTTWYRVLNTAASERAIYQEICRIVLATGRYKLVWVGTRVEREDVRLNPVAYAGQDEGYVSLVSQQAENIEAVEGPDVRALRSGEVAVSQDIAADDTFGPLRDAAVERGLIATAALPLKDEHQVFGALNVYASQPNAFDPQEIEWLTLLTNNLIESLRRFYRPRQED